MNLSKSSTTHKKAFIKKTHSKFILSKLWINQNDDNKNEKSTIVNRKLSLNENKIYLRKPEINNKNKIAEENNNKSSISAIATTTETTIMKQGFRNTQWDPIMLITQIIAMQCLLYVSLGGIMFIMDLLAGANHTLDHLFQYHEIHVTDLGGRLVISGFALNSLVGSVALWFIVRRTKLCLDFSCTFHIIHLLICWWFNSAFPSAFSWWLLNAVCAAIMCVCGEFLCLKTELKEIPVGYSALNSKADL